MLPREKLVRTEFYSDYMYPQGLCSSVGVTIFCSYGCTFMLSLMSASADDSQSIPLHLCLPLWHRISAKPLAITDALELLRALIPLWEQPPTL